MTLTKEQRSRLREMFGGACAYCGEPLGERWHADHFLSIRRNSEYVKGVGIVKSAGSEFPDRDNLSNLFPACVPCNLDKSVYTIEEWRQKLQRSCEVLRNNQPTYRHALRFGLVEEKQPAVTFYFERIQPEKGGDS